MAKKKVNKKEVKKINRGYINEENDASISNLIKIIVIIAIAFCLFYAITYVVTKHNKTYSWENNSVSSVIQYDKIMLGTLLTQSTDEYYVLALEYSNNDKDIFDTYISMYKETEGSLNFYTVDLDSDFNKKYIAENSNFNINSIKDLEIKDTTLFKIKNSKIVEHIEGNEQIIKKFANLVK